MSSRFLCVYLVVRENLLHLFIHCDCNAKLHSVLVLSSESESAIVYNCTNAIHILWCASLLDDSCLSGHRFIVAIVMAVGGIKGGGVELHALH